MCWLVVRLIPGGVLLALAQCTYRLLVRGVVGEQGFSWTVDPALKPGRWCERGAESELHHLVCPGVSAEIACLFASVTRRRRAKVHCRLLERGEGCCCSLLLLAVGLCHPGLAAPLSRAGGLLSGLLAGLWGLIAVLLAIQSPRRLYVACRQLQPSTPRRCGVVVGGMTPPPAGLCREEGCWVLR